jgi:hypothetical protein
MAKKSKRRRYVQILVELQKLPKDFEDETFRFQVLDEGEYTDRDWRDDLKKLLEATA